MAFCVKRMESLPEDVVLIISQYLSGGDLASLCATSHSYRDILNRDMFWKSRCDTELARYLRCTQCVVEPGFVSPEVSSAKDY